MKRTVSLNVDVEGDQPFVDLYERLSRTCAGLILDGMVARVDAYPAYEVEDPDAP